MAARFGENGRLIKVSTVHFVGRDSASVLVLFLLEPLGKIWYNKQSICELHGLEGTLYGQA